MPELIYIKVKVHPDARENRVRQKAKDAYDIHVRVPAEEGRANAAVIQLLAQALNVTPARLHIIKGAHTPNKIIGLRP